MGREHRLASLCDVVGKSLQEISLIQPAYGMPVSYACDTDISARSQQRPDSCTNSDRPTTPHHHLASDIDEIQAFPTDATVREKQKKARLKAQGLETPVKKKPKIVEDHYDDCGDNLDGLCLPCMIDTDSELEDMATNYDMIKSNPWLRYAFPIDVTKVAQPHLGGIPGIRDKAAVPMAASTCPACKGRRTKEDWTHTRVKGQCSYPYDQPFVPTCPACQNRVPRGRPGHTYVGGECEMAGLPRRRTGTKVHTPKPKKATEPHAGKAANRDGVELGQEGEAAVARADEYARRGQVEVIRPKPASGHDDGPPQHSTSASSSSSAAASPPQDGPRAVRGPDLGPRQVRTFRDEGTNPENPSDWTNFDIGKVVRVFRTDNEASIRQSLRKLHVRWWHASEHTMKRFLEKVGVSTKALDLIPEICQTCKTCREWQTPGPSTALNTNFADTFNQQVECDLLFVGKQIIFHMIDRCTRWHATVLVPGKDEETLMTAIDTIWVSIHGPMKELITDGESGIVLSNTTNQYLARKGIKLHPRGKDQHARFIERRGALLRTQIHKLQSQLRDEGMDHMPFQSILAEATFCGNALLTINNSTPYNAVYGRVPHILPSIDQLVHPSEGSLPAPGLIQHTHRLREIAVQAMVEGTARERLLISGNTRTTIPAKAFDFKTGDEVDVYREPTTKDAPGWMGPATIIDLTRIERGIVTVRYHNKASEVQLSHIRKHLYFHIFLADSDPQTAHHNVWEYLRAETEKITRGHHLHFGHILHRGSWIQTSNTSRRPGVFRAAKFFAENHLHLRNVGAVRLSLAVRELPESKGFHQSVLVMWRPDRGGLSNHELSADSHGVIERV